MANSWIVLDLNPEYSNIDINEELEIIASLKSSNDDVVELNLLPALNISLFIDNELVS